MKDNYLDCAEQILRFKSHRDPLVKRMVITLIPTLAAYDTQTFTEHFLHKSMAHLLTQLEKSNERSFGESTSLKLLQSILISGISVHRHRTHCCRRWERYENLFGSAHGTDQTRASQQRVRFLPQFLSGRALIKTYRKKNIGSEEPIFQCLGMLASAVGPNLTKLLHDQLDLMFACGLSEPLQQALVAIVRQIPPLLKTIQGMIFYLYIWIRNSQWPLRSSPRSSLPYSEWSALQASWCTSIDESK